MDNGPAISKIDSIKHGIAGSIIIGSVIGVIEVIVFSIDLRDGSVSRAKVASIGSL